LKFWNCHWILPSLYTNRSSLW